MEAIQRQYAPSNICTCKRCEVIQLRFGIDDEDVDEVYIGGPGAERLQNSFADLLDFLGTSVATLHQVRVLVEQGKETKALTAELLRKAQQLTFIEVVES